MARTAPSPDVRESTGVPGRATTIGTSWQKVVGIMGIAVVLWVGGNLYETVTSGGSSPRGGENQDPPGGAPAGEEPPGDAPPGDAPHDPSRRAH